MFFGTKGNAKRRCFKKRERDRDRDIDGKKNIEMLQPENALTIRDKYAGTG